MPATCEIIDEQGKCFKDVAGVLTIQRSDMRVEKKLICMEHIQKAKRQPVRAHTGTARNEPVVISQRVTPIL